MNDHLKIIFKIILPKLENAKINYWVYGGVAIAGLKGEWLRQNDDVDVFVLKKDFEKTCQILFDLAKCNSWRFKINEKMVPSRPKCELFFQDREGDFFSVIPVYKEEDKVRLVFPGKQEKYFGEDILEREQRKIEDYKFFSPKREFVTQLFTDYLKYIGKRLFERRFDKYKIDGEYLLSDSEYLTFFTK